MSGALVGAVEMPQSGGAWLVPCELDGERIMAAIATGSSEVTVDTASRKDPAWVNLRFADRIEVKDVPALTADLSAVSRQAGTPVKALLGVHALRRLHATVDRRGSQFVIRQFAPPAPPDATKAPIFYVRGGGLMLRAALSSKESEASVMAVDSSSLFPLALDDAALKVSGANLSAFAPNPGTPPSWKVGTIPMLKVGALELPLVPTAQGAPVADYKPHVDVRVSGVVGAGLLAAFRITFGNEGRTLWLELDPAAIANARASASGTERPGASESINSAPILPQNA